MYDCNCNTDNGNAIVWIAQTQTYILLPLIITKDNNENAKTIYGIQRTQGIQRIQEWIR